MPAYYLAVIVSSIAGLWIAFYIALYKKKKIQLYCPLKGKCEKVIQSEYSRFLHIPVEYLGIAYYAVMSVFYLLFLFSPGYEMAHFTLLPVLVGLSFLAFLFSLYLTYIQISIIKEFCTWSFASAILATLIFLSVLKGTSPDIISLLIDLKGVVFGLHVFGLSLGFGGTIFSTVLFYKFLKDYRIEKHEFLILKQLGQLIWLGLGILIVTGFALYVPEAALLNDSPRFILKIMLIGIVLANGLFYNLFIMPHLTIIPFRQLLVRHKSLRDVRKLAFALGSVAVVTWFYIFMLGIMRQSYVPYELLLGGYMMLLSAGLFVSQAAEFAFSHKKLPLSD